MEVSSQIYNPAALPPVKPPRYPLDIRVVGPHLRSGRRGEKKISCPCWELNPGRQAAVRRYTD
jgi:hypothetical protein